MAITPVLQRLVTNTVSEEIQGPDNGPQGDSGNYTQTTVYGKIFINIVGDNGQPTNGNNIKVYYRMVENGIAGPVQSINIPGQGVLIFDGVLQTSGYGNDPNGGTYDVYRDAQLTGQTEPGTSSPPLQCDLVLSGVEVVLKESAPGANDAVVLVYAYSSYNPIEYRVDGGVWKSNSNGFANLSGGNHLFEVRDANALGCLQSKTVNIPTVSDILVSDSSKEVNGVVSRWNAAFNPIVFTYQRKDFDVTAIVQDTETLNASIDFSGNPALLTVGEYVYIKAGLINGVYAYEGVYSIVAIRDNGNIVINEPYIAPGDGLGYINIDSQRPYYKVITRIKYVDPITGRNKVIPSDNRPDASGLTKADISSFLQSLLIGDKDGSNYTQINFRDTGLAASYQIEYAESWEGYEPKYSVINNPYYVNYAAKQLGQKWGGNMFDHVTQPGGEQLAEWLTDFIEPVYANGFPFDLPFIYSEQVAGRQLYYNITTLDINRQVVATNFLTGFLQNEDQSYILNQDGSKFIIARQEFNANVPIVEHVGVNRLLINAEFPDVVYYLQVQLFYDDNGEPMPVTKPIVCRVDKSLKCNPVYVRWVGLNGGWNYYRFFYSQDVMLDVQNSVIIQNYVTDWENQQTIERVLSKSASEKVKLKSDAIKKPEINGLQSIKYSPIVQVLTSKNPIKWLTIVVNTGTFDEYDTQESENEFSITYNLPSKNIQTQ